MLFYQFSADSSIFGGRPNHLGVDEAFADLSVHTLHCADIGLNQCLLSQAGMNAVVCALTDVLRNLDQNNLDNIVNVIQLLSPL